MDGPAGEGSLTTRRLLLGVLTGLVAGAGAVAALPRVADDLPKPLATVARLPERLWAQVVPPRVGRGDRQTDLAPAERDAVGALARRLRGFVVWSSNRSGNHELYRIDLPSGAVRRLTDDPAVDFFSRVSPDGRQIVFLRSQREWVSFRDPEAWDVYLMSADGTGQRRVARGGYSPTWTPDGRAVVFLRGTEVLQLEVGTGGSERETLLLDGAATDGIRGGLETPELSPDGRGLALTVRSRLYNGVAVVDLASRRLTRLSPGQACQLAWTPQQALIWVEPGGRGRTRIMTAPRPDGERAVLIDLPGRYSHEYFPRASNDGRWLIWGASAEGHEHDRADYEVFVWKMGTPLEQAVRLTHHPGNDQWPDLWLRPAS
jgi:Tol biopolymer transport system component